MEETVVTRPSPASVSERAGSSQVSKEPRRLRLMPRLQVGLSPTDRAILIGRSLALIGIGLAAAAAGRLTEAGTLALLGVSGVYILAVLVLAREKERLDERVGPVAPFVDLLLISWAAGTLGLDLTGLYYVVILVTAIRHGKLIALLVGVSSSLLYILIDVSPQWPGVLGVDVLVQSLTFVGASALAGYLAEIIEVERRAKNQAINEKDSKSELLWLVSHESKNYLEMIRGPVDLLLEGDPGPINPLQKTFLLSISDGCERLISLAVDHLSVAWAEAGNLELKMAPLDVRLPVRKAVEALRQQAAIRRQQIHLDYPQVLPKVNADAFWIQQVVVNLLSNASKYTSEGGDIYVSVADNQNHVLVSVTDDGAGMSREERERAFEPFYRGQKPGVAGTGLGLAIIRYIVEEHGGTALVDTSLGRGTTFLIALPKESASKKGATQSRWPILSRWSKASC